ncbi:unnamed protein product [Linum tenue]|uniref:Uncharacterized protein n=1 Tax=Linum tenue TaxID=586396 RepID=A0AAV0N459_9ROSI|nr:unnamed protein product [Linum tenue]
MLPSSSFQSLYIFLLWMDSTKKGWRVPDSRGLADPVENEGVVQRRHSGTRV